MSSTISPNMGLIVPTVGVEPGPDWASDLNASLSIVDGHNHSSGQGVQIQPSGLNINSDLSFQLNNAILLRSSRYSSQGSVLAGASDVGCVYVVGNELYYNDVSGGNNVQITNNGSVNAGAGSIGGLPSGTASATYAAGTFTWQSATSTAANMDFASAVLRNGTASSKGLTLAPPSAMAADISLTLPSVPAAQGFVTLDASGNFGASIAVSNGITASNIAALTITASQIANATITASKIVNNTITSGQIASATLTGTQIASNVNLAGKAVTENGNTLVVASYNAANSLAIIRGQVTSAGGAAGGEGFSSAKTGTGSYTVAYAIPFTDAATVNVTVVGPTGVPMTGMVTSGFSSTGFTLETYNASFAFADAAFMFTAIAQRA